MPADRRPGGGGPGGPGRGGRGPGQNPDRRGAPKDNRPHRSPGPRPAGDPRRPTQPAGSPPVSRREPAEARRPAPRPQERPKAAERIGLPMVAASSDGPTADEASMTYIAYGEQGEDVAFEITEDLAEAVEIIEQMRDDGFQTKLFQAQEIQIELKQG